MFYLISFFLQFAGRWYEISRTQGTPERGDCSHFEFLASESAGAFNVKNVLINDNFHEEYEGTMTSDISDTPAKFILDLPNFGEGKEYIRNIVFLEINFRNTYHFEAI